MYVPNFKLVSTTGIGLLLWATSTQAATVDIPLSEASFTTPTLITNPYWPLLEGSSYSYIAETEDGCEYNRLSVTSDVYQVNVDGTDYDTRVIRDQAWFHEPADGDECDVSLAVLEEDTLDYYAQDDAGNIWYFGEDTWSKDDEDQCSSAGSWKAGVDGAIPGIVMLAPANIKSGLRYRQEFYEDNAEDWGAVKQTNAKVSIDYFGELTGCLMTKEWTPLEPGHVEHKFYCKDAADPGLMFIEELKEKTVYVEYVGPGPFGAPGEDSGEFPAAALGCL